MNWSTLFLSLSPYLYWDQRHHVMTCMIIHHDNRCIWQCHMIIHPESVDSIIIIIEWLVNKASTLCVSTTCTYHRVLLCCPCPSPPVNALICWFSNSTTCCSLSISIINGTINTKNAVPEIHAAFPVLLMSFFRDTPTSSKAPWIILD